MISHKTKHDILSSWGSAAASVTLCSPLEVIKMNAQVTSSRVSIKGMVSDVYRNHGTRGFYKGLLSSLAAQPGYWTIYWPIYNTLKDRFQNPSTNELKLQTKMGIIFASSCIASMTVNPLFVFKTRFQTSALKPGANVNYSIMARDILKKEGIRGFYKGNFVAQIKNTQMVLQMPLYDYFRNAEWNPLGESPIPILDKNFASGVVSKTIASCFVYYPIDCIRTNIRNNIDNKSILQMVKEISQRPGGFINFYRGVGLYWISAVPTFGMIMYFYEILKAKV